MSLLHVAETPWQHAGTVWRLELTHAELLDAVVSPFAYLLLIQAVLPRLTCRLGLCIKLPNGIRRDCTAVYIEAALLGLTAQVLCKYLLQCCVREYT